MKIFHVVYDFSSDNFRGGVQKMVFELACAQVRAGRQVEVLALGKVSQSEMVEGLSVKYFKNNLIGNNKYSWDLFSYLIKFSNKNCIVHVHNTFELLNLFSSIACRVSGAKLFAHPHGALDPELFANHGTKNLLKRIYISLIERRVLNSASMVFALTDQEKLDLRSLNVDAAISVVPNAVAPSELCFDKNTQSEKQLNVLYIGRINRKKCIEKQIVAISQLIARGCNVSLSVGGNFSNDLAYYNELQNLSKELKVTDKIVWLGFLNEAQKKQAYKSASVFVHTSSSEGMAIAVLEAMAAGIPVVVTKGCRMTRAAKAGALIEAGDEVSAIADAIESLRSVSSRMHYSESALRYVRDVHAHSVIEEKVYRNYSGQAV